MSAKNFVKKNLMKMNGLGVFYRGKKFFALLKKKEATGRSPLRDKIIQQLLGLFWSTGLDQLATQTLQTLRKTAFANVEQSWYETTLLVDRAHRAGGEANAHKMVERFDKIAFGLEVHELTHFALVVRVAHFVAYQSFCTGKFATATHKNS